MQQNTVLEIKDLKTRFVTQDGLVHAVNGISYSLNSGEALGIVGESGCGKSVSMLSVLQLLNPKVASITADRIDFQGRNLLDLKAEEIRRIRGNDIAMIFQDPMTSLNPVLKIGRQIQEPLMLHEQLSRNEARDRAVELLERVGIPSASSRLDDYPHQFSGGMRQRVMIAIALACSPTLLIADEPTTALDVTIQAQIIELVKELRRDLHMTMIWITPDLGVVAGLAERVIVMYAGFVVEDAPVDDLYNNPQHPYTKALLGSLPEMEGRRSAKLTSIPGLPPNLYVEPASCPFAPRCTFALDKCRDSNPALAEVADRHRVACWVDPETGHLR